MKRIRDMSNKEIEDEINLLNTLYFRKIRSRVCSLQAELRARKVIGKLFKNKL